MPYKDKDRQRASTRAHYYRNAAVYKQRAKNQRKKIRAFVWELRQGRVCNRCGFDNIAALDFHHRDGDKVVTISQIWRKKGWGKERILAEVAKCEVLCSNCHRIEHSILG